MKSALVWLRRDLRLRDHRALFEATHHADKVLVVFVYDTVILDELKDNKDKRLTFIHMSLEEVHKKLGEHGSGLLTLHGDPAQLIPMLADELNVDGVFCSHDDDPYALRRDYEVAQKLGGQGVEFHSYKDHVIFERQEVLNQSGLPFRVYTPYSKAWKTLFDESRHARDFKPDFSQLTPAEALPKKHVGNLCLQKVGFEPSELWLEAGEDAAAEQLAEFLERVNDYSEDRNFPAIPGTSGLSVHLRFGTISIRECVREAISRKSEGSRKWLNELIWRDFYHMILANFPQVGAGHAFQDQYDNIHWPGDKVHFQAWKEGQTGFPIVDAAMRCLNATGWMHNRLRMICASFLVKDLLTDWRKGEAYFAEKLLDFELASNNGGWQWSASTGVDAQPYFRVFNPVLQSRKFDPKGEFSREWCPELKEFDDKAIHSPSEASPMEQIAAGCEIGSDYPAPIVEHARQKEIAIRLFESAKSS